MSLVAALVVAPHEKMRPLIVYLVEREATNAYRSPRLTAVTEALASDRFGDVGRQGRQDAPNPSVQPFSISCCGLIGRLYKFAQSRGERPILVRAPGCLDDDVNDLG